MIFTIAWSVILFLVVVIIGLTLRKNENIGYFSADLWLLTAIVKLVIIVFMYCVLGSFVDRNVWVDTVNYFTNAEALSNNVMTIGDLTANMEWPPHVGYEILLGYVFKITGNSDFFAGFFNGFLSIIGSLILYKIGQYVVNQDRALKIAALFNLYPLTIHFSLYVLKDISVMLLCELCVLFGLQILIEKRYKSFYSLSLTVFILLFFRSFYAIFAILWLVICFCLQSEIGVLRRIIYIAIAAAGSIVGARFLSSSEINAGYTVGGSGSFLSFIPQMRLQFTIQSFLQVFSALGQRIVSFVILIIKELLLVFAGPFYWTYQGNFLYIYSTTNHGYRYILFENLGSFYMLLLIPGFVMFLKNRLYKNQAARFILIMIIILFCSLILVGDVRWKLSIMPYIILLSSVGLSDKDNIREKQIFWLLFELMVIFCVLIKIIV